MAEHDPMCIRVIRCGRKDPGYGCVTGLTGVSLPDLRDRVSECDAFVAGNTLLGGTSVADIGLRCLIVVSLPDIRDGVPEWDTGLSGNMLPAETPVADMAQRLTGVSLPDIWVNVAERDA